MTSNLPKPVAAGLDLLPGLLLCLAVTAAAVLLTRIEVALFGAAWLEPLVMAILVGAVVRTCWAPSPRWRPGIGFSAKMLLEIAVFLLGASISARSISAAGPNTLVLGIAGVVVMGIAVSFTIGRDALRLNSCKRFARTSFPTPLSPTSKTLASVGATCLTRSSI